MGAVESVTSLGAQTVRAVVQRLRDHASLDSTRRMGGMDTVAVLLEAADALAGLVASVEALTKREADALKALSLATGRLRRQAQTMHEWSDAALLAEREAKARIAAAEAALLAERDKLKAEAGGDGLGADAVVDAGALSGWLAAAGELEAPYPEEVFTAMSDEEVERAVAAMNAAVPYASERMHAGWARHWAKCLRESEYSARPDLTSSTTAAKVPPVQAAPDSPREDASAPEGTAT